MKELVNTLVQNGHETLKNLKAEIVDNDEIWKTVIRIVKEYKTTKDLKKDYSDKTEKLQEPLLNYMGENDLKNLKTEFPDKKWKFLTQKSVSIWILQCSWWLSKTCLQFKERRLFQ